MSACQGHHIATTDVSQSANIADKHPLCIAQHISSTPGSYPLCLTKESDKDTVCLCLTKESDKDTVRRKVGGCKGFHTPIVWCLSFSGLPPSCLGRLGELALNIAAKQGFHTPIVWCPAFSGLLPSCLGRLGESVFPKIAAE
jgi:hypothetical protein